MVAARHEKEDSSLCIDFLSVEHLSISTITLHVVSSAQMLFTPESKLSDGCMPAVGV